ncbi:Predicted Zn-dependent peptidase [Ligilactobacillus sp. WC1T17]|uniref:Predicted Zn-dependent peptidase n=1 Tax=Ligilactobacillus ruminis TaxID=1623 RepID=A0ABY1A9W5_9LACO|nr:Predicted Zn-dependent peptidase [Ligilactobacillus ruminis]
MQKSITDGVELILIPTQQFKTNRIMISFMTELSDAKQLSVRTLLSNVLETSSRKYNTQRKTALALSEMYGAGFGTTVSRHGNLHLLNFIFNCIDDKFLTEKVDLVDLGFEFLKEMILDPLAENGSFDNDTFKRQQQNLVAYVNSIKDNKQSYAAMKLQEHYFDAPEQKTPIYGTSAAIETITPQELYQAYLTMLTHDRIQIVVSGDIDFDKVENQVRNFNFSPRVGCELSLNILQEPKEKSIEVVEQQDLNQSKLDLAYYLPIAYRAPLHYAALVFNGLFGGSPLSKLFVNVREKESLAYYASSSFDPYRFFLMVQTGIQSENKAHVVALIQQQLTDLAHGNFTLDEMDKIKASLINNFESRLDSQMTAINREQNDILTKTHVSTQNWIDAVKNVTKEQVQEVASLAKLQCVYFLDGGKTR